MKVCRSFKPNLRSNSNSSSPRLTGSKPRGLRPLFGLNNQLITFFSSFVCFGLITLGCQLGFAQFDGGREPSFAQIPEQLNEKAILECLPKLKGFISSEETASLDSLKTKIERVYGFKRPLTQYRELIYKNQANEKWKVEFYLLPDSLWGKEKYKLKFFKTTDAAVYVEATAPIKDEVMTKEAALRFAQYEQVESDERWEKFVVPGDPLATYKSKDFKLFELSVFKKATKSGLICTIVGGHSYCQCSK